MSEANSTQRLDKLGVSASLLCGIHCAIIPILAGLPWLASVAMFDSGWIDSGFLAIGLLVGFVSMGRGYRVHRRIAPSSLLAAGLTSLILSFYVLGHHSGGHHSGEGLGLASALLGAALVCGSHLLNRSYCRRFAC